MPAILNLPVVADMVEELLRRSRATTDEITHIHLGFRRGDTQGEQLD